MNTPSLALSLIILCPDAQAQDPQAAINKAVDYLAQASLTWPIENRCFSCHNNGDTVRVLAQVEPTELRTHKDDWQATFQWLVQPHLWETSKTDEAPQNPVLAPIQFGSALVALRQANLLSPPSQTIDETVRLIVQGPDPAGFWPVEPAGHLGSPGTFGNSLATTIAVRILASLAPNRAAESIERAQQWTMQRQSRANVDLAAGILLFATDKTVSIQHQVNTWTQELIDNQTSQGGWGPYPNRFPEIFDTAIALRALCEAPVEITPFSVLDRGQRFLLNEQEDAGGWPETTRPSGGTSYAQHIATSAWALDAVAAIQQRQKERSTPTPKRNKPSQ